MNNSNELWESKIGEIASLCKKKGYDKQEYLIICAFATDDDTIEKFGEIEALDIVIKAMQNTENWQDTMEKLIEALEVDLNARPDIIIDP